MQDFINWNAVDDPRAIMAQVLRVFSLDFECCLPAIVRSYNRKSNTVTVQPAINQVSFDDQEIARLPATLPVFNPAGGGIGLNFPLQPGDTGYIIAGDRDNTLFLQNRAVSIPNTGELHRFKFGFFVPDQIKGFDISDDDDGALVIQTLDGTTKISIKGGAINIVSSAAASVQAKTATVNCSESAVLTTPAATLNGDGAINGNLTVSGNISCADAVAGSVSLKTHIHSGVTTGPGSSGPPVQQ